MVATDSQRQARSAVDLVAATATAEEVVGVVKVEAATAMVEEEMAAAKADSHQAAVMVAVTAEPEASAAGTAKVVEEMARYPQAQQLKYTLHRSIFWEIYRPIQLSSTGNRRAFSGYHPTTICIESSRTYLCLFLNSTISPCSQILEKY